MPKAIPVLKSNLDYIIKYADNLGFNLDYLPDNLEALTTYRDVAGNQEVLYLITDGTSENHNVTFTDVTGSGFEADWTFDEPESPTEFRTIKRI